MRFSTNSSPLSKTTTDLIKALLISAMLIMPAADTYADEDEQAHRDSKILKRQILYSLDQPELGFAPQDEASKATPESGFKFSVKKGPIQYRNSFLLGDDEVSFKISGPLVKRKPGLKFRIQGLHVGELPLEIEGHGNTKGGSLRFKFDF